MKKILIIDDSLTIRQQLNFTISKSGFEVIEAADGVMGLAVLKDCPDVAMIISDINMPNMNGLEMVEKIQAQKIYSHIPIIMLTTEGSSELIQRAKAAGAKGWLVKPFKPDQLIATINKLVV